VTYFEDLTPYTYLPETVPAAAAVFNVGWLDGAHSFTVGEPPREFADKLGVLCAEHATARTRGFHWCDLCLESGAEPEDTHPVEGTPLTLGSAEVRVLTPAGEWLAAPDLVYHYVVRHSYLPPEPFTEAVLAVRIAPDPSQ
jgi:hypothetical protein